MNKMIEKINGAYVLQAADGVRIITRDEVSHNLLGILTSAPAIGQVVIRTLTADETAEYTEIRRKERNIRKATEAAEKAAEKKAADKAEHRAAVHQKWAEKKAQGKAIQAETEVYTAVKTLERADKQEGPAESEKPGQIEEIKAEISAIKAYIKAAADLDPHSVESAREQMLDLAAELHSLTHTPAHAQPEKKAVEPIGKPDGSKKAELDTADVCNIKRVIKVLREIKIPQAAIDLLAEKYTLVDLHQIVFADLRDELKTIKGIGNRRAELICKALQGRIPEPAFVKKMTAEIREQARAAIRERAKGFSLKTYEYFEIWRAVLEECLELKKFIRTERTPEKVVKEAREKFASLKARLLVSKEDEEQDEKFAKGEVKEPRVKKLIEQLTVRRSNGRIVRLNKSAISDVMGVDYESKKPTSRLIVLDHKIQDVFGFHWSLFANEKEEGEKALAEFINDITDQFLWYGVREINQSGVTMFTAAGSSSGHIKQEKVLMGQTQIMKEHENFFWFGRTMDQFSKEMTTSGAEFWKVRANLLRPWMKPFGTKEKEEITVKDILVVKDVDKIYKILNGRKIGNDGHGQNFKDGQFEEPVTIGDGAMIAIYPLAFQGQASTALFKGFLADGTSSIVELCKKHGISVEDFLNMEVEGVDGKIHRIGDYKVICGEGCWKGNKAFKSYTEYMDWMAEMEKVHPGISKVYLLRQAEEIEDEEKVRRLTRTLIQQWMHMSGKEIRALTKRARTGLKRDKTFWGALNKLAGLWKTDEERTEVEKLFMENPWLIASPVIQMYLGEQWKRKQIEAASGKFRTEGQYPYIMQDPVALLEVWVLGMDPNDPNLGILKTGEVSCADVPDGRKVLCVRFPANFLTARVKVNRACTDAFGSLNGVLVLSIHDHILIIQDGDVDGDEMCVIYNKMAIHLTERMIKEFNPPVILFKHEKKAARSVAGSKRNFVRRMAVALADAKRYDSVGLYANLAMRCCYLATIAHKQGNLKKRDEYLKWMSAASTGAILALDQVKGNTVDLGLVRWLESISKSVDNDFRRLANQMGYDWKAAYNKRNPFIQWYVAENKRRPIEWASCLPENPDNYLDETCGFILRDTGKWEDFDCGGATWNELAAYEALTNGLPKMKVPEGAITKEFAELLGDNWFKVKSNGKGEGPDPTEVTLDIIRKATRNPELGLTIGLKEFVLLLWRNESSMSYTMEGRQLWEKKEEYILACRDLLRMLIQNGDWSKKNVEIKDEDKWDILVNALVQDALELDLGVTSKGQKRTNGVDKKGSYAMFVLRLIAPELRRNAKKNNIDQMRFFGVTLTAEDLEIESKREQMEDEAELFESSSFTPDTPSVPEYSDDQLDQMAPPEEECTFSISDDIDYSQCPD